MPSPEQLREEHDQELECNICYLENEIYSLKDKLDSSFSCIESAVRDFDRAEDQLSASDGFEGVTAYIHNAAMACGRLRVQLEWLREAK